MAGSVLLLPLLHHSICPGGCLSTERGLLYLSSLFHIPHSTGEVAVSLSRFFSPPGTNASNIISFSHFNVPLRTELRNNRGKKSHDGSHFEMRSARKKDGRFKIFLSDLLKEQRPKDAFFHFPALHFDFNLLPLLLLTRFFARFAVELSRLPCCANSRGGCEEK